MAEYTIPNIYFNDLENKINKISRKGAHIVFNVINDGFFKNVNIFLQIFLRIA